MCTTVISQHLGQQKDLRKRNQGLNIRVSSSVFNVLIDYLAVPRGSLSYTFTNSTITEFYMSRSLSFDPKEVLKH